MTHRRPLPARPAAPAPVERAPSPPPELLYDPTAERDACGMGFVADLAGRERALGLALGALARLEHRGGLGADAETGDGSGVMLAVDHAFFWDELARIEGPGGRSRTMFGATPPEGLAVGQLLLPKDASMRYEARSLAQREAHAKGFMLLGWRRVPVEPEVLGKLARATLPFLEQPILVSKKRIAIDEEERRLGVLRRSIEREARVSGLDRVVVASLSTRTIVYKGLVRGRHLGAFYPDLVDPRMRSAFALFHERFSTNTQPSWELAQPFSFSAHNGEINTIGGNRAWLFARERELLRRAREQGDHERIEDVRLFDRAGSDSKSLDEVLGRLHHAGYRLDEALLALVPAAWEGRGLSDALESFYRYHARAFEPFDGPAAIAFADGVRVGACLDRNGLRPARVTETDCGLVALASETGLVDLDPATIVRSDRLGPGQALVVDLADRRVLRDAQLKRVLAVARPYGAWLRGGLRPRPVSSRPAPRPIPPARLARARLACGLTDEELERIVWPMARDGKQAVGSMGNDTPLPPLSRFPRPLAHYFSQRFAQVTNPPIDPHRERLVMSLRTVLGARPPLLEPPGPLPDHLELDDPVIDRRLLRALDELRTAPLVVERLDATFARATGATGLIAQLERLGEDAVRAVEARRALVVASDRDSSAERVAIPSVLVAGALHEALAAAGLRHQGAIILETGDVWDAHALALAIGAGADAVAPHLAFEAVRLEAARPGGELAEALEAHSDPVARALYLYRKALCDGLLQIMAKMGISTLAGYRGARLFEAIGLSTEVIDRCLPGVPTRIAGLGFAEIAEDLCRRHDQAYGEGEPGSDPGDLVALAGAAAPPAAARANGSGAPLFGYYGYRRDGEEHAVTPDVMRAIQRACRDDDRASYRAFTHAVHDRPPMFLRDLLELRPAGPALALDEVEPAEAILARFCGAAMSIGALSAEMHETLAAALNLVGGRSNSGEGGEDPARFGTERESKIKQVASARFGVTTHYLVSAHELEIKMAQGSKPGEGGHLPGVKVSVEIARLRNAMPGVTLISPPPHHDIYSIEDLAQLIYDLKQVNPGARVVVKLVSEIGIGTVACGVVKAFADAILVSGWDGGTGASPLGSIKYAGLPWELGLSETQQQLVRSGLRGRIVLRADGGMRTGRDVLVAALLGAEEIGFGTMPLIAGGCVMQRRCHLNTCSVGVATQRRDLRARFRGEVEHVARYFRFVAEEVRELLASLGLARLDDAIGRSDLLGRRARPDAPRAALIDLGRVLAPAAGPIEGTGERSARRSTEARNAIPDDRVHSLDLEHMEALREALGRGERFLAEAEVQNVHRAVGTRLGGELVRGAVAGAWAPAWRGAGAHGAWATPESGEPWTRLERVPHGLVTLRLAGAAGQSLGAFLPRGVRIELVGDANDYAGKGLSGGEVFIRPNPRAARIAASSHEHVIVGNTCLYGATSGSFYAAGRAGERFCVRNSGAVAVCEGAGDHACEYMTGGVALFLGRVGSNVAAGMTGGLAYFYDADGDFDGRVNQELVEVRALEREHDDEVVRSLLERHIEATGSAYGRAMLEGWEHARERFRKVVPRGAAGDAIVQRAATSGLVALAAP